MNPYKQFHRKAILEEKVKQEKIFTAIDMLDGEQFIIELRNLHTAFLGKVIETMRRGRVHKSLFKSFAARLAEAHGYALS